MVTVCHLINSNLMVVLHNSGKVLLSMADPLFKIAVGVVDFKMAGEVMKHLSWDHQFAWDLTTREEVIWLKRAMASPINMQIIRVLQLHSLNLITRVIHLKISLMEDSVHPLIPTHTTLAPIGVGVT